MVRDYQARKYIFEQTFRYNDSRLTNVLIKAFDIMFNNKEPDGCFSTSVALHVILSSFGYAPKICYGKIITSEKHQHYHAWLELDGKVLDLAVYGNSHFSPFWHDKPLGPVVFENYVDTPVCYKKQYFDNDWTDCNIYQAIKMGSIAEYISQAPSVNHPSRNGMWALIFSILDETYTSTRRKELEHYACQESFILDSSEIDNQCKGAL